ncbi:PLP-dependent aminotransferase family protein [Alcaligenes faecalis]|uniref:aminotransferase-like domain-containing protein n=1 Tax=Alcaligenes faecalis TaxID=511 RepID=UPI000F0AF685|nr:PLP-dependent aminotransferase family protein [Alcaligenes faecalis]AYR20172.1 PLP-dependent aminotransferase family protein [Alcaligenes faecalis]
MDFYERLKEAIVQGEWAVGQPLPSIRKMMATENLSHHTVVSAYTRLVGQGMLEALQGRGYFVARWSGLGEHLPLSPCEAARDPLLKILQATPEQCKLGCGWLPVPWRDTDALAKAIRKTARSGRSGLVEYGDIQGYLPLRKQLSMLLRQSTLIEVSPQQIVTTLGATQALDLIARIVIRQGDYVLVDEPCSSNLIKLIRLCGGVPVGVPRLADGPDVAVLEQILQAHKVRAFFCNSTFHNPTGAGLSPKVAFAVVKLAAEHDFLIVEDDVYGDFFPGVRQTFAGLGDLEHVVYIGSFSKSLSASLRIGYIACGTSLLDPLIRLKLLTSVAVPGFCERFVNTILADSTYAKHTQAIQRQLMTHQHIAQKALTEYGWVFEVPAQGGMFLWVGHPQMPDLTAYIERLEQQGILLMPGASFAVDKDFRDRMRLNVAHLTQEVMPCLGWV